MDGSEIADRVVGAGKIETGNAESEIADTVVGSHEGRRSEMSEKPAYALRTL